MIILGIETSCDETAAAIVKCDKDGVEVLSDIVTSSEELHKQWGGIIPELAARRQLDLILPTIQTAIKEAFGIKHNNDLITEAKKRIDALAVTTGPGLIGSLLVGVETARVLAHLWDKPLIPVNHLIAHLYANFIKSEPEKRAVVCFPAVGLVVSGGHTEFFLIENHGKITRLGGTRDDAAGEAFDKCARLLELPYPGGPAIAKLADRYLQKKNIKLDMFPRPMIDTADLDMSFSGLKTAVMYKIKKMRNLKAYKNRLAAEIQEAIVDVLICKSIKAIRLYSPRSFLLGGGGGGKSKIKRTDGRSS